MGAKTARKRPAAELDLAAKKKHVRELAKHSRWKEISRLYGDKMVVKAKEYVEKNRSRHTPQSLAKEILARNGYQSVPPRTPDATKTSVQSAKSTTQPAAQRPPPLPVVIQRESPETITEEQKRLIELRRREALERRNRQRPAVPPPKNPAISSTLQTKQAQAQLQQQAIQKEIEAAAQLLVMWEEENPAEAHVVTPEKTQQSTEYRNQQRATQPNAHFRNAATIKPQCSAQIIHEVDAAADIIRWELEEENRGSYSMSSTRKPPPPENVPAFNIQRRAPSIADEIAAAADVARWEYEHKEEVEIVNKPPPRVRQCRIDEPNFQILSSRQSTRPCPPLHSTTMSIVTPSKSNETPQSHSNNRGPLPKKHPANEFTQTVIQTEKVSESRSFGVKPQDEEISHACALSTFVQKHFVDEKFEDSVLDFVEMMLS